MTSSHSPESSAPDRQAATTHTPVNTGITYWRRAVGRATELTWREQVVLRQFECFADWTTMLARPGHDTIAADLNMHPKTLQKVIRRLTELGWLAVYTPSRGSGHAVVYRLMLGEHRALNTCSSTPEPVDGKGVTVTPYDAEGESLRLPKGSHQVPEGESPGTRKGVTATPPSFFSSKDSSKDSLSPASTATDVAPTDTDKQREIEGFPEGQTTTADATLHAVLAFWPNRLCRKGTAKENAQAQIEATTNHGIDDATLIEAARAAVNAGDVDSRTWLNAWISDWEKTHTVVEQDAARHDLAARIATCGTCDDYGWIEHRTDAFFPTTQRCTHPGIDETAVAAARHRLAAAHIKSQPAWMQERARRQAATSQGYDAYRDAPRPSKPVFHDDDAPQSMWDRVPLVS